VSNHRKRILILCTILIACGGWIGLASRPATGETESEAWTANPDQAFLRDPNLPSRADIRLGSRELFLKMMLSVGLVIVLGGAALYISKKVLPKVINAQGKEIRVRETTYLGPRKALHLVEIGDQRLLIGSTNESITTLAHLTEGWLDVAQHDLNGTVKL